MARQCTTHSAELKLKVAIEANSNEKTVNQIASKYGVYSCQVSDWKKQLKELGVEVFRNRKQKKTKVCSEDVEYLQQQVGRLTVELEWLKKKQGIA